MIWWWFLLPLALANTETYLFQVPYYYDIPAAGPESPLSVFFINSSCSLIEDYPIIDKYTSVNVTDFRISLPYDTIKKPRNKVLVKINNYYANTFTSEDLFNVKLCWPATLPYDFWISHRFIVANDLKPSTSTPPQLGLYVEVEYQAKYTTFSSEYERKRDEVFFGLFITKLPSRIPIPLELYDFIVYLVDIMLLVAPYLNQIKKLIFHI